MGGQTTGKRDFRETEKARKSIDDISEKNKENNALLNEFSEQDKRILEKQKQLEELMEELMTEEIRELFDEMEPYGRNED